MFIKLSLIHKAIILGYIRCLFFYPIESVWKITKAEVHSSLMHERKRFYTDQLESIGEILTPA